MAAAAPKAIGAGIGTLLAGGDMGDAALNAVGFGAGNALMSQMMGTGAAAAGMGAPATSMRPMMRPDMAAAAAAVPADASASAFGGQDMMQIAGQISQALGGGQQQQPERTPTPAMAPPPVLPQQPGSRISENPMLASMSGPATGPADLMAGSPTVPSVGTQPMMPAQMGIGGLPVQGQQPMSNDMMFAGMSPNQSGMVTDYLRSRNMIGFV
jgi:hypothetical protein